MNFGTVDVPDDPLPESFTDISFNGLRCDSCSTKLSILVSIFAIIFVRVKYGGGGIDAADTAGGAGGGDAGAGGGDAAAGAGAGGGDAGAGGCDAAAAAGGGDAAAGAGGGDAAAGAGGGDAPAGAGGGDAPAGVVEKESTSCCASSFQFVRAHMAYLFINSGPDTGVVTFFRHIAPPIENHWVISSVVELIAIDTLANLLNALFLSALHPNIILFFCCKNKVAKLIQSSMLPSRLPSGDLPPDAPGCSIVLNGIILNFLL